jgi:hypothetical protein
MSEALAQEDANLASLYIPSHLPRLFETICVEFSAPIRCKNAIINTSCADHGSEHDWGTDTVVDSGVTPDDKHTT